MQGRCPWGEEPGGEVQVGRGGGGLCRGLLDADPPGAALRSADVHRVSVLSACGGKGVDAQKSQINVSRELPRSFLLVFFF